MSMQQFSFEGKNAQHMVGCAPEQKGQLLGVVALQALDRLQAACPGLEAVTLPVAWFGDDLRANTCQIRPGVETRTSSPLRITRGDDLQSLNTRGLYPAGEGAGYAGGILSAGVDGIKVAEAVARDVLGLSGDAAA